MPSCTPLSRSENRFRPNAPSHPMNRNRKHIGEKRHMLATDLSIYLPIFLAVYLCICLSVYQSIYMSVRLSVYVPISLKKYHGRLNCTIIVHPSKAYYSNFIQPTLHNDARLIHGSLSICVVFFVEATNIHIFWVNVTIEIHPQTNGRTWYGCLLVATTSSTSIV